MLLRTVQKFSLAILFIICSQQAFSQKVQIKGQLKDLPNGKLYLIRPAYPFTRNDVYMGWVETALNSKGEFSVTIDLAGAEIMKGAFADSAGNQQGNYNFYLSPGDNLKIERDIKLPKTNLKITGKGANNNQMLAINESDSIQKFYKDTLPGRVMAFLEWQHKEHQQALEDYIKKYHPSAGFIAAWKANLQYEVLNAYFSFATGNAYQIREAYKRNLDKWNAVKESLYLKAPLANEAALVSAAYKQFLRIYLIRTKEGLWTQYRTDRAGFLLEWYGADTAAGAKTFAEDQSNDLQQKIIEKNFKGRVKEYLYATLLNGSLGERDFKNIFMVYRQFKMQFPASSYLELFEEPMRQVATRQTNQLSAKMKLMDSTGQFKTWEDVLAHYKGKTVLLDMWGTWCGPCRQDLDKHSAFIKDHFKDKPLNYLYIANRDAGKEKLWRELIAYFNLEGDHIMATDGLTKDIMTKVKGEGYPTYVIIHKDGSFEQYNRGYGIDREALVAQLETALSR